MKKSPIFIAVLCLSLLACSTQRSAVKSGKWSIESIYGKAEASANQGYIEIDTDMGMIGGYDGCNSFGGSFSVSKGGEINIKDVISTARYCPEMEGKKSISETLNYVSGYKTKKSDGKQYLILTDKDGKECITLYKATNAE